jgi:hypothetical protein
MMLERVAAADRAYYETTKPPPDRPKWRPPRRNAHYIMIGRECHHLMEWSRLCGISHANLLGHASRHGLTAMIRRIRLGLAGKYVRYERTT